MLPSLLADSLKGIRMSILSNWMASLEAEALAHDTEEAAKQGLSVEAFREARRLEEDARERHIAALKKQADAEKLKVETEYREHFGRSLGLPVAAHVGHIIRLAGLSETSMGSGTVRNTVQHVVLDADFERGRLSRKRGDLLCRSAKTVGRRKSMAISGTGDWHPSDLAEDGWHDTPVTCEACKEVLARLQKNRSA